MWGEEKNTLGPLHRLAMPGYLAGPPMTLGPKLQEAIDEYVAADVVTDELKEAADGMYEDEKVCWITYCKDEWVFVGDVFWGMGLNINHLEYFMGLGFLGSGCYQKAFWGSHGAEMGLWVAQIESC